MGQFAEEQIPVFTEALERTEPMARITHLMPESRRLSTQLTQLALDACHVGLESNAAVHRLSSALYQLPEESKLGIRILGADPTFAVVRTGDTGRYDDLLYAGETFAVSTVPHPPTHDPRLRKAAVTADIVDLKARPGEFFPSLRFYMGHMGKYRRVVHVPLHHTSEGKALFAIDVITPADRAQIGALPPVVEQLGLPI